MSVITISREYGSDGRTIAQKVSEAMSYHNIDKELLVEVAQKAKVPVSEVERYDEQPEHPALRILRKFLTPGYADTLTGLSEYEWWATATVPELSDKTELALTTMDEEVYVKLTAEVAAQLAEQGNIVLLGRGGQAVLSDRKDALHVRVVATEDFKIEIAKERDDLDADDDAIKRIKEVDDRRKTYIRRHYNLDWDDARFYHLTVNTGLLGVDGAVDTIVCAAHKMLG
jgi:cytidylate kinase